MSLLEKLCSIIKGKGLQIRISDGKPFDPHDQKRTTWTQDIIARRKLKEKKHDISNKTL